MEALHRNTAVHAIADFVEQTDARLSLLRQFYITEEQRVFGATEADKLLIGATSTVNELLQSFTRPVSVWHDSPQLNALVHLTLHEWQGFSAIHPGKLVVYATCMNPAEHTSQRTRFALPITGFVETLRSQHPLDSSPAVYWSHEPKETILDTRPTVIFDRRRAGAIPSWHS